MSEILQPSPRTVETHIYKAVKQLEAEISQYLGYSPKRNRLNDCSPRCCDAHDCGVDAAFAPFPPGDIVLSSNPNVKMDVSAYYTTPPFRDCTI